MTGSRGIRWVLGAVAFGVLVHSAGAQVFVVGSFDPRLTPQPYKETAVPLSSVHLDHRDHTDLIRIMDAEQAFTMRAIPLGHKGLTLHANGKVTPDGSDYQHAIMENGVSIGPGSKAVVTDIRIDSDRVILDLNGGPDKKHKWLQHVQIGGALGTRSLAPEERDAVGCRVTLVFHDYVPQMTGTELKALLRPLLDFSLKSPTEAYVDTLPPKLKAAILDHKVLVGMDREMVLQALGQPERKLHEKDSTGALYDEWLYGKTPHEVQMVRLSGDRVTQVELAGIGKDPIIRKTDETDGYLATRQPGPNPRTRDVAEGDAVSSDSGRRPPPTLRKPGEPVPDDTPQPVQMPPQSPNFAG